MTSIDDMSTMSPSMPRHRRSGAPRRWVAVRMLSLTAFLTLCGTLVVAPDTGLLVFTRLVVPVLPLLFFVAPGLWRNVCPVSAANQIPRVFGFTRGKEPPRWLRERGYLVAITLFALIVPARVLLFNTNGPALAALLLAIALSAGVGGFLFKGKSGWCSSICPMLPIERLYGQTPFLVVRNTHCEPCVGLRQQLLRRESDAGVPQRPRRRRSLVVAAAPPVRERLPRPHPRLLRPARVLRGLPAAHLPRLRRVHDREHGVAAHPRPLAPAPAQRAPAPDSRCSH